jgi:hypothetical protein
MSVSYLVGPFALLWRHRWTGAEIAERPRLERSTVARYLARRGLGRLYVLEPTVPVQRYEHTGPGELLDLDVKKLGQIARVGYRITGDRTVGTPA